MNRSSYGLIAILVIAALGVGAYFWLQRQPPVQPRPAAAPAAVATPPAAPPPAPAIRFPIETTATATGPAAALPPLDKADTEVNSALKQLLGLKPVMTFLKIDGFVRRVAATVDNLARPFAAPRLWPVKQTPGRFSAEGSGDESVVSAKNARRYAPFVSFVESVDTGRAVALYVRLYPLFQKAYQELGFPGRYFNDRLVAVIDVLLETPEPAGPLKLELTEIRDPVKSVRPWVRYRFSDPELEALSSGQKMLLRTGPVNERRLKAKLADFRRQLVRGPAPR